MNKCGLLALAAGLLAAPYALAQSLPSGLVQTQAAGDNSQRVASTAYIDRIVPRVDGTGNILFPGGPTLGTFVGGTYTATPDKLTINPATGLDYQFSATRTMTGTQASGVNANLVNITSDTAALTGANFGNYFTVQGAFGGSTMQGGRQGVQVGINQTAATNASNANRNYVAGYFGITSSSGDGGLGLTSGNGGGPITSGQAAGGYFGINPVGILHSGATNVLNLSGGEVNIAAETGSSLFYKSGIQISSLGTDQVQGSSTDAMISLSNQPGAVGWKDGILFGPQNGAFPISTSGYLLRSYGSGVATVGINAQGIFTSSFLAGSGIRPLYADQYGDITASPASAPTTLNVKPVAYASLPTCNGGAEGTFGAVTDGSTGSFNSPVTGGGPWHVAVYCNSAQWVVH